MCGFFPPHSSILQCQQGVLQVSGDNLRPHRLRTQSHKAAPFSNANLKSRLLPVILTNCVSIRRSQRPLHGFYNMLQWFWTQEYSLLPICQLIINGYNSVITRLKRCIGQEWALSFMPSASVFLSSESCLSSENPQSYFQLWQKLPGKNSDLKESRFNPKQQQTEPCTQPK